MTGGVGVTWERGGDTGERGDDDAADGRRSP